MVGENTSLHRRPDRGRRDPGPRSRCSTRRPIAGSRSATRSTASRRSSSTTAGSCSRTSASEGISDRELAVALRQNQLLTADEALYVFLETNGQISVIPRARRRRTMRTARSRRRRLGPGRSGDRRTGRGVVPPAVPPPRQAVRRLRLGADPSRAGLRRGPSRVVGHRRLEIVHQVPAEERPDPVERVALVLALAPSRGPRRRTSGPRGTCPRSRAPRPSSRSSAARPGGPSGRGGSGAAPRSAPPGRAASRAGRPSAFAGSSGEPIIRPRSSRPGPVAVAEALGDLRVAVQVDAGLPQRRLVDERATGRDSRRTSRRRSRAGRSTTAGRRPSGRRRPCRSVSAWPHSPWFALRKSRP